MKLLLIQSRSTPHGIERERVNFSRAAGAGHHITYVSTLDPELPWADPATFTRGYDAILFGGSGDFDLDGGREENDEARITSQKILKRITPLVHHLVATDTPTLGVCYGHQLIAEIFGGAVTQDHAQMKLGSHDVTHHGDDPLFIDIPHTFVAQYGHKDSVTRPPRDATRIAYGTSCEYSALRYGTRVYTTQFHPELNAEDIRERLATMGDYLPGRVANTDSVRESPHASSLIRRFLDLI